MQLTLY